MSEHTPAPGDADDERGGGHDLTDGDEFAKMQACQATARGVSG